MRYFIIILLSVIFFLPSASYPLEENKFHLMPMAGGSYYNREGRIDSDYGMGLGFGYRVSEWISVQGQFHYTPVNGDDYYFILLGGRYTLTGADFFMTPSFDLHSGVLVPKGDKTDIDTVVGFGAMLLYATNLGVQFGPQVSANVVFEGPHFSLWVTYVFLIKYDF